MDAFSIDTKLFIINCLCLIDTDMYLLIRPILVKVIASYTFNTSH